MPLRSADARRLLRRLLAEGVVVFVRHARDEMRKDDLNDVDAVNVLRGGVVEQPECQTGAWRYRVRTRRMFFVVEIEPDLDAPPAEDADLSEFRVVVVTAWRVKP